MSYKSLLKEDNSDRKSLMELEKKLIAIKNNHSTTANSSPKFKQLPMSNYCTRENREQQDTKIHSPRPTKRCPSKRKKRNENHIDKLPKLTGWLTKNPKHSEKNKPAAKKDEKRDNKNNKNINELATSSRRSDSCMFEEIVELDRKIAVHQEYAEKFEKILSNSQESIEFEIDKPTTPEPMLDCKHLTEDEVEKACRENFEYLSNIFHGIVYCERHERFQNENPRDRNTNRDLKCNMSIMAFTHEQKQQMLSYIQDELNKDKDIGLNLQYLFKVLLPELTFKIFRDVHNMTIDEASEYLDNVQLPLLPVR